MKNGEEKVQKSLLNLKLNNMFSFKNWPVLIVGETCNLSRSFNSLGT